MTIPVVTAVTPKSVSSAGGVPVMVQGSGFVGTTAVTFGFTAAASFTVMSDTTISAVSPLYDMHDQNGDILTQTIVDIFVTNVDGTSVVSPGDQIEFTYVETPEFVDPFDPITNLRLLIGERIKPGKDGTDTMFTNDELTGMIARHSGNLYLAAAEGWEAKSAEYAGMVDVNESGSQRTLSQLFRQANQKAQSYQAAGIKWQQANIERPIAKSASILRVGVGGPNDGPALGVPSVVDPNFDPWYSPTARWWPLVTVFIG